MAIKFKLTGARALEKALKELEPRASKRAGDNALRAGARVIVKDAKARVPVLTGELRDNIAARMERKKSGGERSINIGVLRPVSRRFHLTEFGTAFTPAQPFLRPALENNTGEVLGEIQDKMARAIRVEAEKMAKK
jgi:HK97 gp10 family phage protein